MHQGTQFSDKVLTSGTGGLSEVVSIENVRSVRSLLEVGDLKYLCESGSRGDGQLENNRDRIDGSERRRFWPTKRSG